MFCVKCGREGQTYQSLCPQCFLESNKFASLPERVDLIICAHGDEYLINKKWREYEHVENAAHDFVADQIVIREDVKVDDMDIQVRATDPKNFQVHVLLHLHYEGLAITEELDTLVRIRRSVCPKCNKIAGNYFESIVQIRPTGRRFSEEEREEALHRATHFVEGEAKESREAFIAKVTQEHNGYDIYISTIGLGKSISRDLVSTYGAEYKESASLQGQKDGRDIYRVTYLVRLPPYRVRDILLINDRLYLVHSTGPQSAKLRDLKSNENLVVQNSELRDVRVAGTRDEVVDAVILAESDRELQIMHPVTYKTVEIKKPQNFKPKGETVKVFPYENELYLIGN
jgi:nonsense-mediated mRNA decay protein 3